MSLYGNKDKVQDGVTGRLVADQEVLVSLVVDNSAAIVALSENSIMLTGGPVIPTSDPAEAGSIWADNGVLKVSAGT